MVSKLAVFCIAFTIFDVISAQVIRNFGCGCGCGCGLDVLPNQVFLNQPGLCAQPGFLTQPGLIPGLAPNLVSPAIINGQYSLPAANIIQDNSVANNLANTLQLLLVSNLLASTLPNSPDLLTVPTVSPYAGGLSYIC